MIVLYCTVQYSTRATHPPSPCSGSTSTFPYSSFALTSQYLTDSAHFTHYSPLLDLRTASNPSAPQAQSSSGPRALLTGAPSLPAILEAVGLCEFQSLILLQETENWVVSVLHTKHNASGGQHEVKCCSARWHAPVSSEENERGKGDGSSHSTWSV